MPTIKDSVFTEVALRRNAIEPERLRQARATQDELQAFGITKSVAMVILDKGLAPKEVVQGIAEEAESLWIRCPDCKEPNPVSAVDRHGRLKCRSCEQGIEYKAERISEEDLALSLRPSNERSRKRTPPPAASAPAPHPPALPVRSDREAPPESARAAAPARHERKRTSQAGPKTDAQASTRQAAAAAPFSLDHSPLADVTKFKAREIIAVSPCGRLYRIDGGGDFKALKVLDGALAGDKAQLKKWIKTMQTVQDLPRSASMKPVELHREGTTSYVVRPYFEDAKSLRAALDAKSEEIRAAEAVVKIAGAMLDSLLAFHSANLAHGNLKPENVLFRSDGACFTDPGLCTLLQGLPPEDRALRLWESCRYHAPEVLQGEEPTAASDVYSVGQMLEEVLDALDAEEQASEAAAWLRKLAGRMAARDPVARYPSAKEVLWDFHARGSSRKTRRDEAPPAGALEKAIPGRPGHRRPRPRAARLAGPAVLALVLAGLACQAIAWHSSRKAMASPGRDEEVSARLIEERIRDLARSSAEVEPAEAERRWRELSDTFRGTPWEERIEEASRRPLEEVTRRRADDVARAVARADALAGRREWAAGALCLLSLGEAARASNEVKEAFQRISDGLFEDEGMVLVTGGTVVSPGGKTAVVGPFVIDAGLLTEEVRAAVRARKPAATGGREGGGGSPAHGVSLDEAKGIAAALEKRLPTAAEWDRLAALARDPAGALDEAASKRIRDLGTLFEWVEDEGEDDLSRAGHGWCRGGRRDGVPITHPARRRKSAAHADVGVRFARDL